jgi:hypothetical protein
MNRRTFLKQIALGSSAVILPSGIIMPIRQIVQPPTYGHYRFFGDYYVDTLTDNVWSYSPLHNGWYLYAENIAGVKSVTRLKKVVDGLTVEEHIIPDDYLTPMIRDV